MSDGVRALVTEEPDIGRLRQRAMRDGMKPLRLSGAMKVAEGRTTIEEVLRNAPPAG
jgi:general secretion pathway protein E